MYIYICKYISFLLHAAIIDDLGEMIRKVQELLEKVLGAVRKFSRAIQAVGKLKYTESVSSDLKGVRTRNHDMS